MAKTYYTEMWARLVTMPKGIENESYTEVCDKVKTCAALACHLRIELEGLKDIMEREDVILTDGDGNELDYTDVDNWSDYVGEVENELWFDDTDDKPLHIDGKTMARMLGLTPDETYND